MHEAKFFAPPNFSDSDLEWLVKRLSQIVEGFEDFYKKDDYNWALGRGNDWFLHYNPQEKSFTLTHRYAVFSNKTNCEAFERTIICVLHWEEYNYKNIAVVLDSGK